MLRDALSGLQGLDDVLTLKRDETIMSFGVGGGIGHLTVQRWVSRKVAPRPSGRKGGMARVPDRTACQKEKQLTRLRDTSTAERLSPA